MAFNVRSYAEAGWFVMLEEIMAHTMTMQYNLSGKKKSGKKLSVTAPIQYHIWGVICISFELLSTLSVCV